MDLFPLKFVVIEIKLPFITDLTLEGPQAFSEKKKTLISVY